MEAAWIAVLAAALGVFFAWGSAPFVVSRINPPDDPVRLILPPDWRVLGFALALTFGVTLLFGLVLRRTPAYARYVRAKSRTTSFVAPGSRPSPGDPGCRKSRLGQLAIARREQREQLHFDQRGTSDAKAGLFPKGVARLD